MPRRWGTELSKKSKCVYIGPLEAEIIDYVIILACDDSEEDVGEDEEEEKAERVSFPASDSRSKWNIDFHKTC